MPQSLRGNSGIPQHVAIIMDGNGRWATRHGRPRIWGHRQGAASVRDVVAAACEANLSILSLFAFSDENWGRPRTEVDAIMATLEFFILKERDELRRQGISFRVIGERSRLKPKIQRVLSDTEDMLACGNTMTLCVALSYGGRSEIVAAARQIAELVRRGEIEPEQVDQGLFEQSLWTNGMAPPDLLIRTSGEHRISNFMLWQLAYTELYFSDVLWPEFRREHFNEAILAFQKRRRRYGLIDVSPSPRANPSQPHHLAAPGGLTC